MSFVTEKSEAQNSSGSGSFEIDRNSVYHQRYRQQAQSQRRDVNINPKFSIFGDANAYVGGGGSVGSYQRPNPYTRQHSVYGDAGYRFRGQQDRRPNYRPDRGNVINIHFDPFGSLFGKGQKSQSRQTYPANHRVSGQTQTSVQQGSHRVLTGRVTETVIRENNRVIVTGEFKVVDRKAIPINGKKFIIFFDENQNPVEGVVEEYRNGVRKAPGKQISSNNLNKILKKYPKK